MIDCMVVKNILSASFCFLIHMKIIVTLSHHINLNLHFEFKFIKKLIYFSKVFSIAIVQLRTHHHSI